jgi:hypothetical protein
MKRKPKARKHKPGPEAERVKLEGDWKANVKTALSKKRPKEGWPKE